MGLRSERLPGAVPMIAYEDAVGAIAWLGEAFGFEERGRMMGPDGLVSHAEMRLGEAVIFLATPTRAYRSPRRHAVGCAESRGWRESPWVIDGVMVFVEDAEAHFVRAKAAGAVMLSGIEEGFPGRRYRVEDCEGHRWMFMERERGG
jgi:uncharacterized glyoxalase superfamily protein PhnB